MPDENWLQKNFLALEFCFFTPQNMIAFDFVQGIELERGKTGIPKEEKRPNKKKLKSEKRERPNFPFNHQITLKILKYKMWFGYE